jgi:glycine/D-amino acid oxidase-like deaminating enzyme
MGARLKQYDVTIVGGGIIGLSIAWQLARRTNMSIALLDKGAGVGEGSTGASSAVCRYRYTKEMMLNLARDGISAYRDWKAFTGLPRPRAEFQQTGVLWMPGSDREWALREHQRMRVHDIATEVLDDQLLRERFPAFSQCTRVPDVATGEAHECRGGGLQLLELEGGYMDPVFAAEDLREACLIRGVDVRFSTRLSGVDVEGGRVVGARLDDGGRLSTPLLINAAGPWCAEIFAAVGLQHPWDLAPTRIQILYLDRPEELQGHIPTSVDMESGIYFRTQNRGQQLVVGSTLEEDEREQVDNPDSFNLLPDDAFLQRVLHRLHHRLPALPYRGKLRGYCGLYTVNRNDVHPIVGPTAIDGFWVANGFSGHGFKLAPAIGSMVAQAIVGDTLEFDTEVSISNLAIDRSPIEIATKSVLA